MSLFTAILAKLEARVLEGEKIPKEIAEIVMTILGTTITPEQIKIKNGVLTLIIPATLKFAVKMKQEQLLEALKLYKIFQIK